jgi:hypothetical protein
LIPVAKYHQLVWLILNTYHDIFVSDQTRENNTELLFVIIAPLAGEVKLIVGAVVSILKFTHVLFHARSVAVIV